MDVATKPQAMKITKIKKHIGAIVTGIDLRDPVDAGTRKRLYDAVVDNIVLIIRGQDFTPAQYQAAAERFGELMEDQNRLYLVDGFPLISSARFKIANPDILKSQQESRTPPMIQPLVRTHPERGTKAVWFHKGKTENILGMTPEAAQEFLQDLTDRVALPEFCYAHEYQKGDMLIIDDRSALHKAGFDYDHSQHRLLYRILVRGDRPY